MARLTATCTSWTLRQSTTNSSPENRLTTSPAADGRLEPLGQGEQDLVAAGVAEGVVDQLELVQVDEEDGEVGTPLHRHEELALELVVEERAVAEAGERVVVGQPVELGLGRLAVGDVGERAHDHGGVACVRLRQKPRAERQPLALTRAFGDADDDVVLATRRWPACGRGGTSPPTGGVRRPSMAMDAAGEDLVSGPALQPFAEDAGGSLVVGAHVAAGVEEDDAFAE